GSPRALLRRAPCSATRFAPPLALRRHRCAAARSARYSSPRHSSPRVPPAPDARGAPGQQRPSLRGATATPPLPVAPPIAAHPPLSGARRAARGNSPLALHRRHAPVGRRLHTPRRSPAGSAALSLRRSAGLLRYRYAALLGRRAARTRPLNRTPQG